MQVRQYVVCLLLAISLRIGNPYEPNTPCLRPRTRNTPVFQVGSGAARLTDSSLRGGARLPIRSSTFQTTQADSDFDSLFEQVLNTLQLRRRQSEPASYSDNITQDRPSEDLYQKFLNATEYDIGILSLAGSDSLSQLNRWRVKRIRPYTWQELKELGLFKETPNRKYGFSRRLQRLTPKGRQLVRQHPTPVHPQRH